MNAEHTAYLYNKYPAWFDRSDPRRSLMYFGFECGDGWFAILDKLFQDIAALHPPDFQIRQVKEKYGTLRVYTGSIIEELADTIWGLIDKAEAASGETCETCGVPGKLRGTGWLYTACDECHERR